MRIKTLLLLCILLLTSCNTSTPAPATEVPPTQQVLPTFTSTPEIVPTLSPILFHDDFDQTLADGWSWQNEDAANWNLSTQSGWLEIMVLRGHIVTGNYSNLLLRAAPEGDFQIETSLIFEPAANFQFAGLIVYQSDADFMQAGRAYCEGTDICIGSGLYFDNFSASTFEDLNFATPYEYGELAYLRLQREADLYTFFSSPDGINWTEVGQHQNGLEPRLVGLVAAQNNDGVPVPVHFDYFTVSTLK
jgi:beta-xylosidase